MGSFKSAMGSKVVYYIFNNLQTDGIIVVFIEILYDSPNKVKYNSRNFFMNF